MLICCHLIAASLVTVINLTNLQWWNVTKYSNIQVQLWHTLFMSTILPLQCIPGKILHFLLHYIYLTVSYLEHYFYLHVIVKGDIFLYVNRVLLLLKHFSDYTFAFFIWGSVLKAGLWYVIECLHIIASIHLHPSAASPHWELLPDLFQSNPSDQRDEDRAASR